jgi:hypothetical protein
MSDEGSMRADLEAVFDDKAPEYTETEQEILSNEDTADTTSGDEETSGSETETLEAGDRDTASEADTDTHASEDGEVGDVGDKEGEVDLQAGDTAKGSGDSIKAPMDWGPQEREQWSKIPRNLQEKVMARETELSTLMSNTADARRTHQDFSQLASQYGSVLSGVMGDTPMDTVSNLFQTVSNLRMGSPIQKAQIVADLIGQFGVDINTLDSAIVGVAPPAGQQQNAELERLVNERMAPFEAHMGQQNAYANQQAEQRQQTANTEVGEFSKTAEFFEDVRYEMADFIDVATKNNRTLTTQDAYKLACAANPQVSAVMAQRAETERLTGSSNTIAAKKNAASSLHHRQVGSGGDGSEMSMRQQLVAAMDGQNKI